MEKPVVKRRPRAIYRYPLTTDPQQTIDVPITNDVIDSPQPLTVVAMGNAAQIFIACPVTDIVGGARVPIVCIQEGEIIPDKGVYLGTVVIRQTGDYELTYHYFS